MVFRFLALLAAAAASALPAQAQQKPPQHVVISFDGALDNSQWTRSRALARQTGARFTYFLSCVYLLSPETRETYSGPGMRAGRSNVGFGYSREDVAERLGHILSAHGEGHEIANHGCGHFDGKDWSAADWGHEFGEFERILRNAYRINAIAPEPEGWRELAADVAGFRAPYLSATPALYEALAGRGFLYDASAVSSGPVQPALENGLIRFSLPLIPEGPSGRPVLAMDYNLYVRHSDGRERPAEADIFEERAYRAFRDAFEAEYQGERRPFQLGFHFTLMNDAAYWRALERFAREACVMEEVSCISHAGLAAELHPQRARDFRGALD